MRTTLAFHLFRLGRFLMELSMGVLIGKRVEKVSVTVLVDNEETPIKGEREEEIWQLSH